MAKDKKRPQDQENGRSNIKLSEIADKMTIDGQPVFDDVTIDPETGDLLSYTLQPDIKARLMKRAKEITEAAVNIPNGTKVGDALQSMFAADNSEIAASGLLQAAIKEITENLLTDETMQLLQAIRDDLQPIQELLEEIRELKPYITAELKKDEYGGKTYKDFLSYTPGNLLELSRDQESYIYKALAAARAARDADRGTQIQPYKANKLDYPTDKLNLFAWDLKDTGGQIKFDLSRAGSDDDSAYARA